LASNIARSACNLLHYCSINDIVQALDNKGSLPEKACLISLDDGLRCQYEVALPILDDLNVPGAFFVMGAPYTKQKATTVT
jgi:peptidoglycan/xylan/chitin deacetylase (PgdA/CDA1 family)